MYIRGVNTSHVDVSFDVTSTVCQQRSECMKLDSEKTLK